MSNATTPTLKTIVEEENMAALEQYCLNRTYRQVRDQAIAEGVCLDVLEEMLGLI